MGAGDWYNLGLGKLVALAPPPTRAWVSRDLARRQRDRGMAGRGWQGGERGREEKMAIVFWQKMSVVVAQSHPSSVPRPVHPAFGWMVGETLARVGRIRSLGQGKEKPQPGGGWG